MVIWIACCGLRVSMISLDSEQRWKISGCFVQAAANRGEALDHTLLHGPPGLGKTTLANIIANELGVSIRTTSGPVLDKPGRPGGAADQPRDQ